MDYNNYKNSRDISWQILIQQNITELPVSVKRICKSMGIRCLSYNRANKLLTASGLSHHCEDADGFTFGNVIFYNDTECNRQRQRFTIAHELGHIVLGHTKSLCNREPDSRDDPKETAANVFAARLLAPACVLWGCGVVNPEQIATLCDISQISAEFRMDRLRQLYERDRHFLKERGHSCFLMHPLERQVYAQFEHYITNHHHRL